MSATDQPLLMIIEEMSRDEGSTSALAKLGKLLYSIPAMNPHEVTVFWHLLAVCSPNATTTQSKEIVRAVRIALWARMQQILRDKSWGHGDLLHIIAIIQANGVQREGEKKRGFWKRILNAA